jgi:hypothetical protein
MTKRTIGMGSGLGLDVMLSGRGAMTVTAERRHQTVSCHGLILILMPVAMVIQSRASPLAAPSRGALADPLPEPSQPPDPPDPGALFPPLDSFAAFPYLALPNCADPPPKTVLDPLPLYRPFLGDEARGKVADAGRALGRQHATLNEHLRRRPGSKSPRQSYGDERTT